MSPITQGLAFAIETGLNQLLPFDPGYQQKWASLDQKTVAVELKDLNSTFYIRYQSEVFAVHTEYAHDVDVKLSADSWDFFRAAIEQQNNDAAALNSNIHFEGQIGVGQTFANCLQSIEIDFEEIMAQSMGDIMAHRTANLFDSIGAFVKEAVATTETNFTEYVQEEALLVPTKIEVENFYDDLRQLRSDCDRLFARVDTLHNSQADR